MVDIFDDTDISVMSCYWTIVAAWSIYQSGSSFKSQFYGDLVVIDEK